MLSSSLRVLAAVRRRGRDRDRGQRARQLDEEGADGGRAQ